MGWPVQVVGTTGSTNADLVAAARAGDTGPRFLVARSQSAGRGRLGRAWQSRPGESLSVSLLWQPAAPQPEWTWLPMVVGLGVLDALHVLGVEQARLKWPNDVVVPVGAGPSSEAGALGAPGGALTGLAKLAGILVEVATAPTAPAVVAGVGLNLRPPGEDLGVPVAWLAGPGGLAERHGGTVPDFDAVTTVVTGALQARLVRWDRAVGGCEDPGVRGEYLRACSTVGRRVRVVTPGGVRTGEAVDVGADGSLVLRGDDGLLEVSAGDVEHVR